MKKMFLKFNTALPSSASVKHLCSVAGDVLSKVRAYISTANKIFEDTSMCK